MKKNAQDAINIRLNIADERLVNVKTATEQFILKPREKRMYF